MGTMQGHQVNRRSQDDAVLVAQFLRNGDESPFRELFRLHGPAMYALATRILGDSGRQAEDAVQEAWVRAAKGLAKFGWRSSLRTWLSGITVNCCREALRVRSSLRQVPLEGDFALVGAADPVSRVDLDRAIAELPTGYREVFVLHDVEGWTHAEIAERLNVEPGTSKSQLSRAREALRARWRCGAAKEEHHAR